jgi:hypothetical protein
MAQAEADAIQVQLVENKTFVRLTGMNGVGSGNSRDGGSDSRDDDSIRDSIRDRGGKNGDGGGGGGDSARKRSRTRPVNASASATFSASVAATAAASASASASISASTHAHAHTPHTPTSEIAFGRSNSPVQREGQQREPSTTRLLNR